MNLPNKLTIVRLIIIPFFLILMVVPFDWGSVTFWGATIPVAELIAAILFIAATITDNLDGRIARRDHLVTNFGKFADPLADKLLVMTAFIVLTGQGVVPSWVTAIIIWRELSVTGLRLLLVEQNRLESFVTAHHPKPIQRQLPQPCLPWSDHPALVPSRHRQRSAEHVTVPD